MKDTPTKVIAIACILMGVWIVTYWLYQPARAITLGDRPTDPPPTPVASIEPSTPKVDLRTARDPSVAPQTSPIPTGSRTRRVQKRIAPEFRDYTVQHGDNTFERIAARKEVFGDVTLGPVIASANPWADPTRLKPGVTVLHIPLDPQNVTGKLVWVEEAIPDGAPDPAPDPTPTPTPAPAVAGTPYPIQRDDTLWKIAEKFYGKGKGHMWWRIADANKDVMPDPDHLPKVGTVIRIPAAP